MGRGERGRDEGIATKASPPLPRRTKGTRGSESLGLGSRRIPAPECSPPTLKRRIRGEGGDGLPGASPPARDPDGANLTAAHDPWELRRPCRPAVPGAACRIRPSPPGPQPGCPPPWLQSCTSRARRARTQNPSREQSIASRRSALAPADGQRAEADTPTRFSPPPNPGFRTRDPRLSCPNKNWGVPGPLGVFWKQKPQDPRLHAPRMLSYQKHPRRVGVPLVAVRVLC